MLPAFTYTRDIGNLWIICSGVNILRPSSYFVIYLGSDAILE